ncbi:MAG: ABC transporter substrate-binding protein [Rhodospirillales bacterium]
MPRTAALATLAAFVFAALLAPFQARAGAGDPREIVDIFQQTLMGVMQEAMLLGPEGRYDRLAPAIDKAFHIAEGAELVSTPHWRKADNAAREKLSEAFRHLYISTLATRFDGYDGQSFVIIDEKDGPRETRIVRTEIVDSDQTKRSVAYVLKNVGGQWGIFDIVVDGGISELSVRRTEYRDALKSNGLDGMIQAMTAKGDELLAGL